jgi:hypothetical protein
VDEIDRELASRLSIEPSPEFRARVRARIADEPAPRSWYMPWRVAAAGAAAAAVLAGVTILRVVPSHSERPAVVLAEKPPAAPVRAVASAPAQPRQAAAIAPLRRAPLASGPEVLVDVTAVRGLRQLDAIVREGRTQFVFADESVPQDPVKDIVVTPIAIAPIEIATNTELGSSGGDGQ